jgi:oligosaccharide 4-alpha-D-glucosyltransferase
MKLRYELLPYIYTTAWQTAQTGIPIVRPMIWHHPTDERFAEMFSQYYFGGDLLVAPVTEAGQKRMDVELPTGVWYHLWTGSRHMGGKSLQLQLALESIPVFARGGSIIPRVPSVNKTADYSSRKLFLHTYLPDGDGDLKGQMFEDDGKTFDTFDSGAFELLNFEGAITNGTINVNFSKSGDGWAGMPESRLVELIIYGLPKKLKEVTFDQKALPMLKEEEVKDNTAGYWMDGQNKWHIRFVWFGNQAAAVAN